MRATFTTTLGKYFEVSGDAGATAADTKIIVKGDVKKVKYLGFKMTAGEMSSRAAPTSMSVPG